MSFTQIANPKYSGFDEFVNNNGDKYYKSKKTGKIYNSITAEIEYIDGGQINVKTPEQVEAYEKYKQNKLERTRNREMSFYFALLNDRRGNLKPQTIARLFYLATFLHYGNNVLRHSNGTPIVKQELPALMKIGNSAFKEFWKETSEKYIFVQPDGNLTISEEFFRGYLTRHNKNNGVNDEYQKVFIKSLRELYCQTPSAKHRYLGYIFLILPCINWEFNVLCRNPREDNLDKIEVMTLEEFCDEIGYCGKSSRNCNKILEAYKQLVFTWKGRRQELLNYLVSQTSGKKYLVVNPYILYRGHDRRNVEALGVFFQNRPRKKKN